jgi:hypothetical protein
VSSEGEDGESKLPKDIVSMAQPITIDLKDDGPLHVVFYPPHNPAYSVRVFLHLLIPFHPRVRSCPSSFVSSPAGPPLIILRLARVC